MSEPHSFKCIHQNMHKSLKPSKFHFDFECLMYVWILKTFTNEWWKPIFKTYTLSNLDSTSSTTSYTLPHTHIQWRHLSLRMFGVINEMQIPKKKKHTYKTEPHKWKGMEMGLVVLCFSRMNMYIYNPGYSHARGNHSA